MTPIALLVGWLMVVAGIVGIVSPGALLTVGGHFLTSFGLYAAAAIRIAVGIVLVRAASTSRSRSALRALGFFILLAGVITPFIGVERSRAMVEWWWAQGPAFMRAWAVLALALGAFVVRAVRRGV